jgi:transcriptional regulator with XRE-family HTH domain
MTTTLQDRMVELMTATGWTVGEIARIAGVTSAAVSQWVGNGAGKQSKSIGNAEAALRLEKASGFSWIWLAQGKGQKLAATEMVSVEEVAQEIQLANALEVLTSALQKADKNTRIALEPLLASMANAPEDAAEKSQLILRLLVTNHDVRHTSDDDHPTAGRSGVLIGGSAHRQLGDTDGKSDRHAPARSAKR